MKINWRVLKTKQPALLCSCPTRQGPLLLSMLESSVAVHSFLAVLRCRFVWDTTRLLSVFCLVLSYTCLFSTAVKMLCCSTNVCRFHLYMLYRSCQCVQRKLGLEQTSYCHCNCITLEIFGVLQSEVFSLSSTFVKGQLLSAPTIPAAQWLLFIHQRRENPLCVFDLVIVITTSILTCCRKLMVTDHIHVYTLMCVSRSLHQPREQDNCLSHTDDSQKFQLTASCYKKIYIYICLQPLKAMLILGVIIKARVGSWCFVPFTNCYIHTACSV